MTALLAAAPTAAHATAHATAHASAPAPAPALRDDAGAVFSAPSDNILVVKATYRLNP